MNYGCRIESGMTGLRCRHPGLDPGPAPEPVTPDLIRGIPAPEPVTPDLIRGIPAPEPVTPGLIRGIPAPEPIVIPAPEPGSISPSPLDSGYLASLDSGMTHW
jgi:hypothetical protein